jgi:hypothetical protein
MKRCLFSIAFYLIETKHLREILQLRNNYICWWLPSFFFTLVPTQGLTLVTPTTNDFIPLPRFLLTLAYPSGWLHFVKFVIILLSSTQKFLISQCLIFKNTTFWSWHLRLSKLQPTNNFPVLCYRPFLPLILSYCQLEWLCSP